MGRQDVIEKILRSDQLPTLPRVAVDLLRLTASDDASCADIAVLIAEDISLSVRVLRVANSSFYGVSQEVTTISQAVSMLGLNAVRSLVLSFCFLGMDGYSHSYFDFKKFWQRSVVAAIAAKLILEHVEGSETEEILVSGLLQNLGEFILALILPEEYRQVYEEMQKGNWVECFSEEKMLEVDHSEVGYQVAKSWGLPSHLCLSILYHHRPNMYDGECAVTQQSLTAIYLSSVLMQILETEKPDLYLKKFKRQAIALLRISPQKVDDILSTFHLELFRAAETLDCNVDSVRSINDILQEANIRLSVLNLNYEQVNRELIESKIALERLTKELEQKSEKLEELAHKDGLTDVYNHRYFQNFLDTEINRAQRTGTSLGLILLDIDHFKYFNDTYGHQTGDFVLCEITSIIQQQLRSYDLLARYGGEEFVVVLADIEEQDVFAVAEKIRIAVATTPVECGDSNYKVTISLGISAMQPSIDDGFRKSNFIEDADKALYEAKSSGRNCTKSRKGFFAKWTGAQHKRKRLSM